jgi:hypothetical protein
VSTAAKTTTSTGGKRVEAVMSEYWRWYTKGYEARSGGQTYNPPSGEDMEAYNDGWDDAELDELDE